MKAARLIFVEPWLVPAPSRPEDYYGFLGSATAFQFVYLTIGREPVRFRPLMPVAMLAKAFFFVTMASLWLEGRAAAPTTALASIDGAIGLACRRRGLCGERPRPGPSRHGVHLSRLRQLSRSSRK